MRSRLALLPMQLLSGLLILALLDACAGVSYRPCPTGAAGCRASVGYGGSGPVEPPEAWGAPGTAAPPWWTVPDEEARKDEASLAVDMAWSVASLVDREGGSVRIGYWSSGGALTPVHAEAFSPIGRAGTSGERSFRAALRGKLELFAGTRPRYLDLTFQRGPASWWLSSFGSTEAREPPPEGRTLPVRQAHLSEEVRQSVELLAAAFVRNLRAPGRPLAEWKLKVKLVDDRAVGLATVREEPYGKVSSEAPEPTLPWELANLIVLFLPGVGEREVELVLRSEVPPGQEKPRWRPAWAATRHQAPPELVEFGTSFAEYKLLREEMLRRWRERTIEYAQTGALFTAREVAIWIVGGAVLHGFGSVVELVAAPLWRAVMRMGPGAIDWLECLLVRIPKAEHEALLRLCARMQQVGAQGLSTAEKQEFRALLDRYMEVAARPLSIAEKNQLRQIARTRFWEVFHPELVDTLVDAEKRLYDIHHEIPLEYAHLLPEVDINTAENLVAVAEDVHDSIGSIWTAVRQKRTFMTAADVQKVAAIIHQHYLSFFNTVYTPAVSAAQLRATEAATLAEVRLLLKSLGSP